jgi:hypothetical protein
MNTKKEPPSRLRDADSRWHRWASTLILMSTISDNNICYSDIGDKYVGLRTIIPKSEVVRYQHQSSFRYLDIEENNYLTQWIQTPAP